MRLNFLKKTMVDKIINFVIAIFVSMATFMLAPLYSMGATAKTAPSLGDLDLFSRKYYRDSCYSVGVDPELPKKLPVIGSPHQFSNITHMIYSQHLFEYTLKDNEYLKFEYEILDRETDAGYEIYDDVISKGKYYKIKLVLCDDNGRKDTVANYVEFYGPDLDGDILFCRLDGFYKLLLTNTNGKYDNVEEFTYTPKIGRIKTVSDLINYISTDKVNLQDIQLFNTKYTNGSFYNVWRNPEFPSEDTKQKLYNFTSNDISSKPGEHFKLKEGEYLQFDYGDCDRDDPHAIRNGLEFYKVLLMVYGADDYPVNALGYVDFYGSPNLEDGSLFCVINGYGGLLLTGNEYSFSDTLEYTSKIGKVTSFSQLVDYSPNVNLKSLQLFKNKYTNGSFYYAQRNPDYPVKADKQTLSGFKPNEVYLESGESYKLNEGEYLEFDYVDCDSEDAYTIPNGSKFYKVMLLVYDAKDYPVHVVGYVNFYDPSFKDGVLFCEINNYGGLLLTGNKYKENDTLTYTPDVGAASFSELSRYTMEPWGAKKTITVDGKEYTYWVAADGTSSTIIGDDQITWLYEESYDAELGKNTGTWYGIKNVKKWNTNEPLFKKGSRFWVRWDKNENGVWTFELGVTAPDGTKYTQLGDTFELYVQHGHDWEEKDFDAFYIASGEYEYADHMNRTLPAFGIDGPEGAYALFIPNFLPDTPLSLNSDSESNSNKSPIMGSARPSSQSKTETELESENESDDNFQKIPTEATSPSDNFQKLPTEATSPSDNFQKIPTEATSPSDNFQKLPTEATSPSDNPTTKLNNSAATKDDAMEELRAGYLNDSSISNVVKAADPYISDSSTISGKTATTTVGKESDNGSTQNNFKTATKTGEDLIIFALAPMFLPACSLLLCTNGKKKYE